MTLPKDQLLCGDVLELLPQLPDRSVQLVITSPPYYRQRNYAAGPQEIGNEPTVQEYLSRLLAVFRECCRVVRNDGSLVFNLGDKYQDGGLLLIPYRFAQAVLEEGLAFLVNVITWVKRNPTPRQFRRRLVPATEPFFHFAKTKRYYYNLDEFQTGRGAGSSQRAGSRVGQRYFTLIERSDLSAEQKAAAREALQQAIEEVRSGRIAGFRMKIRGIHAEPFGGQSGGRQYHLERNGFTIIRIHGRPIKRDVIETPVETLPGTGHPAVYPVRVVEEFLRLLTRPGDLVLDPFVGSGTTAVACRRTGRHFIGIDLSSEFLEIARRRLQEVRR
ncbi:MAG: methyltransferase [Candidatus Poribacteria bacterium]|nr:MAG: methyltransferase [Candidatus Poribacteria bacterium]